MKNGKIIDQSSAIVKEFNRWLDGEVGLVDRLDMLDSREDAIFNYEIVWKIKEFLFKPINNLKEEDYDQ